MGRVVLSITVPIVQDLMGEDTETFTLVLREPPSDESLQADFTQRTATVTIRAHTGPVVFTPSEVAVVEGATAVYTVELGVLPTGSVSITPGSGDTGVATVATTPLVFTTSNWNTAQTVTVTGAQDADALNEIVTVSHTVQAPGSNYVGVVADDVVVTVQDDEASRLVLSATTLAVDEGGQATYTMTLDVAPNSGDVTVTPGSGDSNAATVAPVTLIFTVGNWSEAQTVTVTSLQDDNAFDETVTVSHMLQAGGFSYPGASVVVTMDDDETAAVSISPAALSVGEAGGSATYAVSLDSQPVGGDVVITPSSTGPASVSGALTFTAATWNNAQTVTVTGSHDPDGIDTTVTVSHALQAAGSDYDGVMAGNVTVTVEDDDTAGVTLSVSALTVGEAGGSATYTVALDTQPVGGEVVITASSGGAAATVAPAALTFTATTWNTAQTVRVSGSQDADAADTTVTVSHALQAAGTDYASGVTPGDVVVTVDDDDTAAVTLSAPAASSVDEEGGTTTYTVSLATRPVGGNVVITPSSSDNALATVAPAALTFTAVTWNAPQTVTLTAGMDSDSDDTTVTVSHTLQATGTDYASGVTPGNVVVTVNDNDAPGVNLSDTLTMSEGGINTYTIVLRSGPGVDVIITPVSGDGTKVTVTAALTFTSGNWDQPQVVSVTSLQDPDAADESVTVTHTLQAGSGAYAGVTVRNVVVTVQDDETAAVDIPDTLSVDEGMSITYTVALTSQPVGGDVVVTPSSADTNAATVSGALTFNPSNWNTGQTVTLTGVEDDTDTTDNRVTVTHTASGGDYGGVTAEVEVTVNDNDVPTVAISVTALTVSESGGTATYTMRLRAAPSGDVSVSLSSSGPAATVSATALIFNSSNWSTAQTVTVTGQDDLDSADTIVTVSHTVTSAAHPGLTTPPDVTVTVTDEDTRGLVVSNPGNVPEGGAAAYTVRLNTLPVGGDVTVTPGSAAGGLSFDPVRLVFTAGNWSAVQTVSVSAAEDDDGADAMVTISHTAIGADYDGVTADIMATVEDDDTRGVMVSPTDLVVLTGRIGTYTVRLDTAPNPPGATVTVTVNLNAPAVNSDEITVTPTVLTFDNNNWNTARVVSVGASMDADPTADPATISHAVSGADYGSVTADDVTVRVTEGSLVVSGLSGNVREGAGPATYTVSLSSPPVGGDVTVTPSSADRGLSFAPGRLTFTAGDWNAAQTISVSAAEDDDGADSMVTINHAASGANYDGVTADIMATVEDDDTRGVMVSPTDLVVLTGRTGTYTVRLDTAPHPSGAAVTVTVNLNAPAVNRDEITVTPTVLTFDNNNWNTARVVSVGASMDADSSADSATISHTVAGADYGSVTAADVTVTVTEGSLVVSGLSGNVPEGAGPATYTVSLSSPPVGGDVTVTPSSADGDISLTPARLVFTAGNWNAAQTVSVSAAEDDDGADSMVTINHAASGANYDGITASIVATVADNDPLGVTVSPTDLAVLRGRTGTYTVRLDTAPHPPGAAVTIAVSLSAPAQNRDEVTVTPVALTFDAGNWSTAQAVSVGASTDADSSADPAIIRHTVSGADYGSVTADNVTVTIIASNLGDINEVILSEVARVMGDQQVSAISNRISQAGRGGGGAAGFSFNGQSTLAGLAAANAKPLAADDFDLKSALGNSSFVAPLNASGGALAGSLAFWGGGDYRDLSGKSRDIEWDGNLFSLHLGLDARLRSDLLAGLMVSDSEGDLDYKAADDQRGEYDIDMTSVHPYIGWSLMDGLDLWAATGYGEGDLEVTPDDAPNASTADVTMQMMAVGGNGELSRSERAVVRLKGEAFYTRTHVDDTTSDQRAATLGDADVDAHRARMTVEMESRFALAGGAQLKPSVEAGFRLDGGDGRSGSGLEVGGGLNYHDAARGLTLESRARVLLGHSGDYDEWGISGSMRVDPGADGQGLSVALSPSYGKAGSAVQDIWNNGLLEGQAQEKSRDDLQAHLTARLGYGWSAAALNGRWLGTMGEGTLTPYSALTLGGGKQQYRLGLQWGVGELFGLDVFATRREQSGKADDHAVLLKGEVRF